MQPLGSEFGNGESKGASRTVARLRTFARPKPPTEQCELCAMPLPPEHRHLLETSGGQIVCACDPCALRFEAVIGGRYKLIPRDARMLPDFHLEEGQWEALSLPINLVFIFKNSRANKIMGMYPSPAGATESLLPLSNWEELVAGNPALAEMAPDVEALIINRVGENRDYFIAPIDLCYALVGIIRMNWHGFSGGDKVWAEIEKFFGNLRERAISWMPELEASDA